MRYFKPARRQLEGPRGCVGLSWYQFKLLEAVARRPPGEVTPYAELYQALYNCDNPLLFDDYRDTLDAVITRTRLKLKQVGVDDPTQVLETRRGHGLTVGPQGSDGE